MAWVCALLASMRFSVQKAQTASISPKINQWLPAQRWLRAPPNSACCEKAQWRCRDQPEFGRGSCASIIVGISCCSGLNC
jgi:hypothetical protein